ncbi:MAG: Lanthionine synthetase family protein [Candidatus Solibacter sp.]|nr:Lanthionine synthetase family protein [Candidatus Solibacter sp.]
MWTPIIDPSSAFGARAAAVLESVTNDALASSGLDAPLLLAYRAIAEGNRQWMKLAVSRLNTAVAGADAMYSTRRLALFGGLSGLGWVIEHVTRLLQRFEGSTPTGAGRLNDDTDAALLMELQRGRWKGSYDLASGLTGIGVYFLERFPAPSARVGVELVLAHLEAAAVDGAGVGMLFFASDAAAAGIDPARAKRLLTRGIDSLPPDAAESDLGALAICLRVAPNLAASSLEDWLNRSAHHRDADTAHLWNRIHRMTGDERCRTASLTCWEYAIESYEKATPATSAAGVEFLGGPAGFGLALLAALTPVEPEWDRLLGLSPGN